MVTSMRLVLVFTIFLVGCTSSELLRQKDYQASRERLGQGQPLLALESFPQKKEKGGFISTVETAHLKLLNQKPEPRLLVKISDQLEKREIIQVSKELGHFFYQEAEDGYLPAEHEVIWLHLLAGLGFAALRDHAGARVEAVRAAQLLQGHYEERTGDFDAPELRLILAGLWLYCEEWEHARVDLRRAFEMNPNLKWAKEAAEKPQAPKGLAIVLAGVGPEPQWRPESVKAKLTSLNSLSFPTQKLFSEVTLQDPNSKRLQLKNPLDTASWYERHQQRNTQIRDVVTGSRYLAKATGQSMYTGTGYAASKIAAGTILTVGVATAVALVVGAAYLFSRSGNEGGGGEAIAYVGAGGLALGAYTVHEVKKFDTRNMNALKKDWNETLDPSFSYRYVRFLPDQIFSGLTKGEEHQLVHPDGRQIPPFLQLNSAATRVEFFFVPRPTAEPPL